MLCGKERVVFERSLELAGERGLLDGSVEQIVDSAPMLGAAAVQDTVPLVWSGVRKLLGAVQATDAPAAEQLHAALALDYARSREKPAADWQDKAARERVLVEVATDAQRALGAVEHDQALMVDAAIGEAVGLLREIVGQEFETHDDEAEDHDDAPRPRPGRGRQIISAHDPGMRHGRKTSARRFTGYKLHAAAAAGRAGGDCPIFCV